MASGTIYVDGEIIPDQWIWEGDTGVTSLVKVRNQITALGDDLTELKVFIFSPGGFCSEGWAIYDYLLALNIPVTTIAYGQCASIATVIYMAGSVRQITPNCDFMVHLPWGECWGNKHDVLAYYNELVIESNKIETLYSAVTGMTKEEVDTMLLTDYHMTGQEAIDKKFATEMLGVVPVAVQASASSRKLRVSKAVAYLRPPQNVKLKNPAVPPVAVPRGTVESDELVINPFNKMAKTKLSEIDKFLAGVKNLSGGRPYSAMDINVDGGQVLVIDATDGEPKVGDAATIGGAAAPNGEYTATEDKTKYTIADGKVSVITPATADDANANADQIAELQKQIDVLKASDAAKTKALAQAAKLLGEKVSPDVPLAATPASASAATVVTQPTTPTTEQDAAHDASLDVIPEDGVYTKDHMNKSKNPIVRARAMAYLKEKNKGK